MKTRIQRRTFLKTSFLGLTGLTIGCSTDTNGEGEGDGGSPDAAIAKGGGPDALPVPSSNIGMYLNIAEDGQITVAIAKAEMGQGLTTAIPMIVAEELEADWEKIKVVLRGNLNRKTLGMDSVTGGSFSIRRLYDFLRKTGAAAKAVLIQAGAERWGVDSSSLSALDSQVIHSTMGTLSYGELASEASKLPLPIELQLKDPKDFKIIGQPLACLDAPDQVSGNTVYATDVVLPDMRVATVRQSPVFGGEVSNLTALQSDAEAIVPIPGGVAIVAGSWWEAEKAAQALEIEFSVPKEMQDLNSEDILAEMKTLLENPDEAAVEKGEPLPALEGAAHRLEATYEVPLLAHGTLEPMCCTANVTGDTVELWVPTQSPRNVVMAIEANTEFTDKNIRIHTTYMGGAFGRRIETDYVIQAVLAAQAVGKPTKVIWPRSEDTQHDYYRPFFVAKMQGGIDEAGTLVSWVAKNLGPLLSSGGPPGGQDMMSKLAFTELPYDLPNKRIASVVYDTELPIGWWRSVGASQNTFFVESFIDELAEQAGADPLAFRKTLLKDNPRFLNLLDRLAEMANWGQPGVDGRGQGLAIVEDLGSLIGQIADVSVDSEGTVTVHKVYCAIDCGDVINPDIVKAQVEGGIVFGLTAAMTGEITIENGRVIQSNFHDCPVLSLKEAPEVETLIIRSGEALGGVGEAGVPPIAPAVTNAIYAATKGQHRIRRLPISRHQFS